MPDKEPTASGAEAAASDEATATPAHVPTGLETARALVAGLRVLAKQRPSGSRRQSGYGRTVELSGAHPDARDPALLGSAVEKLVTDSGWDTEVAVHAVFGRWPLIVGAEIAAHCTPESYRDGHLTVHTDSTAWATQLRLLAPNVVGRLNEELGPGAVLRIEVVGPVGPSWRKGRRSVRDGRGPRDTYG